MTFIYITILAIGAVGSFTFVVDYLRTADLDLPYTRLVVTLNLAISGILSIATLSRLGFLEVSPFVTWVQIVLLLIVDVTIWYQLVLLRRIRSASSRLFTDKSKKERKEKTV